MYYPVMRSGAQRQLKKIGEADLVIGLPTYKNGTIAARVARVALEGIAHYYPDLRAVLINADAGYTAVTRQAVAAQAFSNGHKSAIVTGRYDGPLGRGSATAALLDAALALDAQAIVILDSNTQSITPNWIAGLAHLILEKKIDLVMPRYQWSRPDGELSDLIAYPLFRALWGHSVRHPAAPDFALSPRLANALLDEDIWETEVAGWGLSPWLATYAVLGHWRVAQSALGRKQTTLQTLPAKKSKALFKRQFQSIVSVMLRLLDLHHPQWGEVEDFNSLSTLTQFAPEITSEPVPEEDLAPLLDELALGWIEYRSLWQRILNPDNLARVETLAALPIDRFYLPTDLWARILYDFAVVFNKGDCDPYQVVASLLPLYQGRLASFKQEIAGLALVGREGTVAAQAVEFEEARPYLKIRWHTYSPWLT
jgi:hypothetical protein